VETVEGDDLKRLLDGLDIEGPPPSEATLEQPTTPEEAARPEEAPGPQPKLGPPGLAWGRQSNIVLDGGAHQSPPGPRRLQLFPFDDREPDR